jgi:hypothetical protein
MTAAGLGYWTIVQLEASHDKLNIRAIAKNPRSIGRSRTNKINPEITDMSFIDDLLEKPANLSTASKYAAMNGFIYLGAGALLIVGQVRYRRS